MANSRSSGVAYEDPSFVSWQVGTSNAPILMTASGILNGSYLRTSAPSGDTRLEYKNVDFTSTGSGETLRVRARVTGAAAATAGTINGSHISAYVNTTGTISGAANALRTTLGGSATTPGGTIAAIQLDSDFDSGVTVPTTAAFLRVTDSGTAKIPNLLNLPAPASNTIFRAKSSAAVTHVIKIIADGTAYYVMVSDAP